MSNSTAQTQHFNQHNHTHAHDVTCEPIQQSTAKHNTFKNQDTNTITLNSHVLDVSPTCYNHSFSFSFVDVLEYKTAILDLHKLSIKDVIECTSFEMFDFLTVFVEIVRWTFCHFFRDVQWFICSRDLSCSNE